MFRRKLYDKLLDWKTESEFCETEAIPELLRESGPIGLALKRLDMRGGVL